MGMQNKTCLKVEFNTTKYLKNLKDRKYFHTFIDRENLAAGILRLIPGEEDKQTTHESDEVYYVVRGDGYLKIAGKDYKVSEGMSYFVGKNIDHRFHGNNTELVVLYFFSGPDK